MASASDNKWHLLAPRTAWSTTIKIPGSQRKRSCRNRPSPSRTQHDGIGILTKKNGITTKESNETQKGAQSTRLKHPVDLRLRSASPQRLRRCGSPSLRLQVHTPQRR